MAKEKKARSEHQSIFLYVISFLLSLLLILLAAAGVVTMTLSNRSFFKTQVIRSGFCDEVNKDLGENYLSYGSAANFSEDVMRSFIDADRIQQDMFQAVDAFYDGKRDPIFFEAVKDDALAAFEADLVQRGISETAEIKEGLVLLAEACCNDYSAYVSVPLGDYLAAYLVKVQKYMPWVTAVVAALALCCVVLLLVCAKKPRWRLSHIIYAMTAGTLFCVVFPLVANLAIQPMRLNINPLAVRMLVDACISGFFNAFLYFALMFLVVLLACAITLHLTESKKAAAGYHQTIHTAKVLEAESLDEVGQSATPSKDKTAGIQRDKTN